MNFIFISPHFPHTYWEFCNRLKQNGVNVLAIADAPYESISDELKAALTECFCEYAIPRRSQRIIE